MASLQGKTCNPINLGSRIDRLKTAENYLVEYETG
ncbi:hypothetical protein MGMO_53c00750 [Methyloglobulus morosus KoM1]|uniref:Uncharacterized protein n=1 Tax=Methyloglobulus morosus KoM1 TaxID=1116472 RepID=V5DZ93_9GAMM|nr:hypothetical protein MGMO_53c00750 [Methyloglobulus morosus KoM1]